MIFLLPTALAKPLIVCRCEGDVVRGVPMVYGYPPASDDALLELLGEVRNGGCEIGPPIGCPTGCTPDHRRPSDPRFPLRAATSIGQGPLLLAVAGTKRSIRRFDVRDPSWIAPAVCLGDRRLAQAERDGAGRWAPHEPENERDRCLAAWAAERLEAGIDRVLLVRVH